MAKILLALFFRILHFLIKFLREGEVKSFLEGDKVILLWCLGLYKFFSFILVLKLFFVNDIHDSYCLCLWGNNLLADDEKHFR